MSYTQWMWIDQNCYNPENSLLFESLKMLGVPIKRFRDYQSFADSLINVVYPADPISQIPEVKVICSSSLC